MSDTWKRREIFWGLDSVTDTSGDYLIINLNVEFDLSCLDLSSASDLDGISVWIKMLLDIPDKFIQ